MLKPCVYRKTDTSDAIVQCGSSLFSDTIKCQPNPNELFQNINIYGAHIDVKYVTVHGKTYFNAYPLDRRNR